MMLQDGPLKRRTTPGQVDVIELAVFDVACALVVTNGQGQHGASHPTAVDDVAVVALDLLVGLRELDDAIRQADLAVGARLPELPNILTLMIGRGALLRAVLVADGAASGREDHTAGRSQGVGTQQWT